jgi:hypothetical protein
MKSFEDCVFEYLQVKMLEMFHLVEYVHGQVNNVVIAQVQGGQQRQNLGFRLLQYIFRVRTRISWWQQSQKLSIRVANRVRTWISGYL